MKTKMKLFSVPVLLLQIWAASSCLLNLMLKVKSLGLILDSDFNLEKQITGSSVRKTSFFPFQIKTFM